MSTLTNGPPCDRCPPARAGTGTATTARIANARISLRAIRHPLALTLTFNPSDGPTGRFMRRFQTRIGSLPGDGDTPLGDGRECRLAPGSFSVGQGKLLLARGSQSAAPGPTARQRSEDCTFSRSPAAFPCWAVHLPSARLRPSLRTPSQNRPGTRKPAPWQAAV